MGDTSKAELHNCDFVKAVLMLAVVLYHSCLFWNGDWFSSCSPVFEIQELSKNVILWLNTWHIYTFMLVSGYLFYYLRYEQDKYSEFIPFLKKKVQRLLIPAYFVGLIWIIPVNTYFWSDWVRNFLKFISGVSPSQLWFLFMLFDVFMVAYIVGGVVHNNKLCLLLTIGIYFIGFIGMKSVPNVFQIWTACRYFPLFMVGMKLRDGSLDFLRKIPLWGWIVGDIALFIFSSYLKGVPGFAYKVANVVFVGLPLHIVGALMAFFVLQKIATLWDWENSKWFTFLKQHNVTVYLFHQQIIYFVIVALNGVINPYLHMGVNFIVSLSLSLVIALILSRFKVTRFLVGMK